MQMTWMGGNRRAGAASWLASVSQWEKSQPALRAKEC